MDDFFYFTRSEVSIFDIEELAASLSFSIERIGYSEENIPDHNWAYHLNIDDKDDSHWEIGKRLEERDFDGFDPENIERIKAYNPASGYVISYHTVTLDTLKILLKGLLSKYGGWLGCDTDDLTPIFTAENIDNLTGRWIEIVRPGDVPWHWELTGGSNDISSVLT